MCVMLHCMRLFGTIGLVPLIVFLAIWGTFVLVTFVHIRNISAVTDTIWTKL